MYGVAGPVVPVYRLVDIGVRTLVDGVLGLVDMGVTVLAGAVETVLSGLAVGVEVVITSKLQIALDNDCTIVSKCANLYLSSSSVT